MILARKINKIPEFYIIIAQKIFQIFFFGGGGSAPYTLPIPSPVSYATRRNIVVAVLDAVACFLFRNKAAMLIRKYFSL